MADIQHTEISTSNSGFRPLMLGLAGGSIAIVMQIWVELAYSSIVQNSYNLPFPKVLVTFVFVCIAVVAIHFATKGSVNETRQLQDENSDLIDKLTVELDGLKQRRES